MEARIVKKEVAIVGKRRSEYASEAASKNARGGKHLEAVPKVL
jgi:hypothetical protein